MAAPGETAVRIARYTPAGLANGDDVVAGEEPLEIRLCAAGERPPGTPLSVTMRTPGHDAQLALGFLFGEGLIRSRADVADVAPCGSSGQVILVTLAAAVADPRAALQRHFYTSSSCGVCGKSSIDAVMRLVPARRVGSELRCRPAVLLSLPGALAARQSGFARTGGLHAAALFASDGRLLDLYEDVGRHNAADKLVGAYLQRGALDELRSGILQLSGRASFELLQKAAMAGIEVVAAIGAPSSLAIQLANSLGITLVGFLRASSFNVYCGPQRLREDD